MLNVTQCKACINMVVQMGRKAGYYTFHTSGVETFLHVYNGYIIVITPSLNLSGLVVKCVSHISVGWWAKLKIEKHWHTLTLLVALPFLSLSRNQLLYNCHSNGHRPPPSLCLGLKSLSLDHDSQLPDLTQCITFDSACLAAHERQASPSVIPKCHV